MKKLFVVFMSLMFIMCLAGCGEKKEKINIDFIIDGKSHLVEIDKDTSISKDIIPLSNVEEVVELYYDENMINKYNDEKIENDIKIYVKINSNKSIENELKNYIAQFDLNDKKILWDGDINCEFSLECIIIDLKKTNTYPEFKLEYLGINETIKFEYISGPKPAEYLFDEQYSEILSNFRQSVIVYIVPEDKEKIIEIIKIVEELDFVKHVYPNVSYELE